MTKTEMTTAILNAKKRKNTTWAEIAKSAGLSEVYVTSACLGENALSQEESNRIADFLEMRKYPGTKNFYVVEALNGLLERHGFSQFCVLEQPVQNGRVRRFTIDGW